MDIIQFIFDEYVQQCVMFVQIDSIDFKDIEVLLVIWICLKNLFDVYVEVEEWFFYLCLMKIGIGGNDVDFVVEEIEDVIEDYNDICDIGEVVDKYLVGLFVWFVVVGECNKVNSDYFVEEECQGFIDFCKYVMFEECYDFVVKFVMFEVQYFDGVKVVDKDFEVYVKKYVLV